jgi:hypothetical protein
MMGDLPFRSRAALLSPSTDMQAVRDGRRSLPLYLEVDLSTARSIAANTHLLVSIAGNSFYCDPIIDSSGNPIGGVATVHFQDQNLAAPGTPFTVASQFIARVGFTQLLIENPAQAGKRLRIIYGIDVDFSPGINAQVSIAGTVGVAGVGNAYGTKFTSTAAIAAGGTETVWAPGTNVNGVILTQRNLLFIQITATGVPTEYTIAHTSAPGAISTGDLIDVPSSYVILGANTWQLEKRDVPLLIPSGKGLYGFNNAAAADLSRVASFLYTVK